MANKKFSEFVLKTSTSDVSHIVGYNGAENVQITPANFVTGGGTGVFLPLAGGTMTGNTIHNDNVKSIYGTGSDLQIYHSGSTSYISDLGTGDLKVLFSNDFIIEGANGETCANFRENSSVDLYHDGVSKMQTTSTGINVTGSVDANISLSGNNIIETLNNTDFTAGNRSALKIRQQATAVGSISAFLGSTQDGLIFLSNDSITANHLTIDQFGNSTFAGNVTIASTAAPVLTIQDTDATASFNKTEIQNSAGSLLFNTRQSNGTFVSTDYLQSKNTTGTITHQWFTSGTEKMRLDTLGNLGLGSSAPTSKFEIEQSIVPRITMIKTGVLSWYVGNPTQGASNNFTIGTDSGGNLDILTLNNLGNVGVGTSTPDARITLADHTTAAGGIKFRSAASSVSLWSSGSGNLNTDGSFNVGSRMKVVGGQAVSDPDIGLSQTGGIGFSRVNTNDIAFATSSSEKMRLNNSGVLGIGTTGLFSFGSGSQSGTFIQQASYMGISIASGQTAALILRRLEDGTLQRFYNSNSVVGSISVAGSATAYNTSSDYRLKEDLQDFKGLDLVSKIPVYDYKWKADKSRSYGVMAHELEEVLPQAVSGEKDAEEMQSVDYSKIVPLLVKSIQELSAKLEALECQCEKK